MGRVIKSDGTRELQEGTEFLLRLKAYVRGEVTWAEVEGMTWEEAKAIAEVGCDLAAAGRLEEARIIFEGLVEGNPKDSASRAALGSVYQKLSRVDEALAEYSAALGLDPGNPVALAHRGELLLRQGDRAGFADLARAVESDPHGETAAARRARGLIKSIALVAVESARGGK